MNFLGIFWIALFTIACWISPITPADATSMDAHTLFKVGVEQAQTGQFQDAIKTFNQVIQQDSEFSAAYSNRCFSYVQVGDYSSAVVDCTRSLALSPNRSEAYLNRGLAYYQQGKSWVAIADFTQALQKDSRSAEAYLDRGIAYFEMGKPHLAISDLQDAAKYFAAQNQAESYRYAIALIKQIEQEVAIV